MYDPISVRYTFPCPTQGEARVRLHDFRELERLPGTAHPAVFRIRYTCTCGDDHLGLVAHDELDWAPLGLRLQAGMFLNVMTDRLEPVKDEFGDLAARRIGAGEWPWSFFCYPEERPRPVFPSMFLLLAPGTAAGTIGVAVRCPACLRLSINIVSPEHVDVPFHNDTAVGVVEHVFREDSVRTIEEFESELYSASFDARRLELL
jgi:hypothetical protein